MDPLQNPPLPLHRWSGRMYHLGGLVPPGSLVKLVVQLGQVALAKYGVGVPISIGELCGREAAGIDSGDGDVHGDGHSMSAGSEMG